jgi:hypothetical protein
MEASKRKEEEERLQDKEADEKQLSSSDDDDVPIAQTIRAKTSSDGETVWGAKLGVKGIGTKISRQFADLGLFTGKVVAYNSDTHLYSILHRIY